MQCLNSASSVCFAFDLGVDFSRFLLFVEQTVYLFSVCVFALQWAELCNVFRRAHFSGIHRAWDHHSGTTDYLCCAGSRGRRSKCRGRSKSVAVVILKPTNHQRRPCSWRGCGTSDNSRTTRHLHRTASSGEAKPCSRQAASRGARIAAGRRQFEVKDVELELCARSTDVSSSVRRECSGKTVVPRCSRPSGVVSAAPAPVVEYIQPAPAPVVEYIRPAPTFPTVAPSLVVEFVKPAPTFQAMTTQPAYQYGAPQELQYVVAPTTKLKRRVCF